MKIEGSSRRANRGRTIRAMMSPTSSPPPPTRRKLNPASQNTKVPPTAPTATLKATRPVPSLTRLSPPTTVPTRPGTPSLLNIASAATGSVGARIAPRTKAAAHGSPITACATTAIAQVVARTRPTASSTIGLRWARRSRGEEEKAAEFNSGGEEDEKDDFRRNLDLGQPRHEADGEAPEHQEDRVGDVQRPGEHRRGPEQED